LVGLGKSDYYSWRKTVALTGFQTLSGLKSQTLLPHYPEHCPFAEAVEN